MNCKHENTKAVYYRRKLENGTNAQGWFKLKGYRFCIDCKKVIIIKMEAKEINGR